MSISDALNAQGFVLVVAAVIVVASAAMSESSRMAFRLFILAGVLAAAGLSSFIISAWQAVSS